SEAQRAGNDQPEDLLQTRILRAIAIVRQRLPAESKSHRHVVRVELAHENAVASAKNLPCHLLTRAMTAPDIDAGLVHGVRREHIGHRHADWKRAEKSIGRCDCGRSGSREILAIAMDSTAAGEINIEAAVRV